MKSARLSFITLLSISLILVSAACSSQPPVSQTTPGSESNGTPGIGSTGPAQVDQTRVIRNDTWQQIGQNADRYKGSRVDLTGTVFYVLGNSNGGFRFQMYTSPEDRQGNTHVVIGKYDQALREGYVVRVLGSFDGIRTTTSQAGTELKIPMVAADSIELISPKPTGVPSPSATPTPIEPTATTVVELPTATPTISATVQPSPTATPSVGKSPTALTKPTDTAAATATTHPTTKPTKIPPTPTPMPATKTPRPATPTPTSVPATPTPIPATPTGGPSPTSVAVPLSGTANLDLGAAKLNGPMASEKDTSGVSYISSSVTDQKWNGTGNHPVNTGEAQVQVNVAKDGAYAFWARVMYQNVDANSFWLVVDNNPGIMIGNEDADYNVWKWVNWRDGNTQKKTTVQLSAGNHTIKIIGREAGTRIAGVVFSTDPNFKPES